MVPLVEFAEDVLRLPPVELAETRYVRRLVELDQRPSSAGD